MNKYKIEFTQSEKYIVDVFAKSEEEAKEKASILWNQGDYQDTGDLETDITGVYDVTATDDPFYPSEKRN